MFDFGHKIEIRTHEASGVYIGTAGFVWAGQSRLDILSFSYVVSCILSNAPT